MQAVFLRDLLHPARARALTEWLWTALAFGVADVVNHAMKL